MTKFEIETIEFIIVLIKLDIKSLYEQQTTKRD